MNAAQKIEQLFKKFGKTVQVLERKKLFGFIPITLSRGWLWITEEDESWFVALSNGETVHQRLDCPLFGADFYKNNGKRKRAWKSILFLRQIVDEKEADSIFGLVSSSVDLAYDFHCQPLTQK